MGIIRLSVKLTLKSLRRVLIFVCLTALLCIAAGLLGNYLLYGDRALLEPVRVAVVDEDDSLESRMLLRYLEDLEDYGGLLLFERMDGPSAAGRVTRGELDAVMRIPKEFIAGVLNGRNDPFVVTLRGDMPLRAGVIRVFASFYADMLRTGQVGVYSALDAAREVSGEARQEMFQKANMRFFSAMLGVKSMTEKVEVSATGGSPLIYYGAAALVFLILLGSTLFLDIWQRATARPVMLRLRAGGSPALYSGICFLAGAALPFLSAQALLLPGAVAALKISGAPLTATGLLMLLVAALLLAACASGLLLAVASFAGSCLSGCLFLFAYNLMALFLSGGILPSVYLSPFLRTLGYLTPHYWLSLLVTGAASGRINPSAAAACVLWAILLGFAALVGMTKKGKVGRLP